jgi:glycosyltransferase involved in cell wall biosynthesis
MADPIHISVIICTYNRAGTLGTAIESLASQSLPPAIQWEILVVDNNSPDRTRQVVENLQRQHPGRIRYVLETKQGISHARNAGIQEAKGEVLAFLDDDEIAGPSWLQNLTEHLHTGEWGGAGGRVLPPSDFSPPNWLSFSSSFAKGPLAVFDPALKAGQLNEPPFGANMAFRKDVFAKVGTFRTDLGRTGNNLISNEDTELGRRIMAAGLLLRYEPSAVTFHPVEPSRLKKEYFLHWWFNKGRSDIREFKDQSNGAGVFGIPVRAFRRLAANTVRWMATAHPSRRFGFKVEVWNCAGQIVESYHQWKVARQKGETGTPGAEPGTGGR